MWAFYFVLLYALRAFKYETGADKFVSTRAFHRHRSRIFPIFFEERYGHLEFRSVLCFFSWRVVLLTNNLLGIE